MRTQSTPRWKRTKHMCWERDTYVCQWNEQLLSHEQVNSNEKCGESGEKRTEGIVFSSSPSIPRSVTGSVLSFRFLKCGYLPSNMSQRKRASANYWLSLFSISLFIDLISSYFMSCRCNIEMIFLFHFSDPAPLSPRTNINIHIADIYFTSIFIEKLLWIDVYKIILNDARKMMCRSAEEKMISQRKRHYMNMWKDRTE